MSPPTGPPAAAELANDIHNPNDHPTNLLPDQDTEPIPDNSIPPLKANEAIGDKLNPTKHHTHTRFYLINPHGINVATYGTYQTLLEQLKPIEPDILMLPEINLDTTNPACMTQLHNISRSQLGLGEYKLEATSSTVKNDLGFFKWGGVTSIAIGNIISRITSTSRDSIGRWTSMTLTARGDKHITWICTYQPNHVANIKAAGDFTALTQHYKGLIDLNRHEPHRVTHHHAQDLISYVQSLQQQGHKVNVCGDFNETIGERPEGLTRLCSECGLIDAFRHMHGMEPEFATYNRGTKVIDYILMDPDLVDSVAYCGYEPFGNRFQTDHRGLFIDVITDEFFGNTTLAIHRLEQRGLVSTKAHQIAPYFQVCTDHAAEHNYNVLVKRLLKHIEDCWKVLVTNPVL